MTPGSPPDPNSFDTPEDVAEAFLASLSQSVEAAEANRTLGAIWEDLGEPGGALGGSGWDLGRLRGLWGS